MRRHFKPTSKSWRVDHGDDQMNEKDGNIEHPGMLSRFRQSVDFGPF